MPQDWYDSFAKLAAKEVRGTDFSVCTLDRNSRNLIIAPHGGFIEPGTSEISKAVARSDYSLYLFEGLKQGRPHCELHITSHRFDEPEALKIAKKSLNLIAIHGRKDAGDEETTWLGGRNDKLGEKIKEYLCESGFNADKVQGHLAGNHPDNICNQSMFNCGVQLEIPRTLRRKLKEDTKLMSTFSDAIRKAVEFFPQDYLA